MSFVLASGEFSVRNSEGPVASEEEGRRQARETVGKGAKPSLPIFSILDSIEFSDHFVIIGDVGTGKSTVTLIHEFESCNGDRQIVIREPSRAACNAQFFSLQALHPELRDELAVITKDAKINVGGKIRIVADGVLLRMLTDNSISDSSICFDESH